ncbi:hypothetical protein ACUL41_00930 [Virgibacillus natechei]
MSTIFEQIGERIATWLTDHHETQAFFAERMDISKQVMYIFYGNTNHKVSLRLKKGE